MSPEELNQRCINELSAAGIGSGGYVAVVGAGPSLPVIPASKALMLEVATACGIPFDENRRFWEFFEEAKQKNITEYCKAIDKRFKDAPYLVQEAYSKIVSVQFKSFITLNYDHYLPAAFAKAVGREWKKSFCVYPLQAREDGLPPYLVSASDFDHKQHLIALHGFHDPNDPSDPNWPATKIILTKSDYYEHYHSIERSACLSTWWKETLVNHDCIFIGTSLQEPGLRSVIEFLNANGNLKFRKRKHLHLVDVNLIRKLNPDDTYTDSYPPRNPDPLFDVIQQIQYDPMRAFSGLLYVLEPFSKDFSETVFKPEMIGPLPFPQP